MCSNCDGHPDEQSFVNAFNGRRQERIADALGQDLLQTYLAAAYAVYLHKSTRELIGHIQHSSPLVGKRRVA